MKLNDIDTHSVTTAARQQKLMWTCFFSGASLKLSLFLRLLTNHGPAESRPTRTEIAVQDLDLSIHLRQPQSTEPKVLRLLT